MERLAAELYLDLGLCIQNAFDIVSDGNTRGSVAAYKDLLQKAIFWHPLNETVVERVFAEKPFSLSNKDEFALRAWASYMAIQEFSVNVRAIDTATKGRKARFDCWPCSIFAYLTS